MFTSHYELVHWGLVILCFFHGSIKSSCKSKHAWSSGVPAHRFRKDPQKYLKKNKHQVYSGHSKSQPTCTLPFRIPIDLGHYLSLDDVGSFVQEHWTKDHPITILLRVRRFGAEKHLSAKRIQMRLLNVFFMGSANFTWRVGSNPGTIGAYNNGTVERMYFYILNGKLGPPTWALMDYDPYPK